jgi:murein DD-endopeptidase MepM/ murein hydrolase activator NlpD
VSWRSSLALGVVAAVFVGGATAAPPVALGPPATAAALAIQIVGPGNTPVTATGEATAPPDAGIPTAPFAYPTDGSIAGAASTTASVSASASDGTASATTEISKLSLFSGEVTADDVRASVSSAGTVGDLSDSAVTNLVVLGTAVSAAPNARIPLADWGHAIVLGESTRKGAATAPSWRGTVTALTVHLDADHGGLPAGTEIRIAYADAYARPPAPPAATTTAPTSTSLPVETTPVPTTSVLPSGIMPPPSLARGVKAKKNRDARARELAPIVLSPPVVTPKLTAGGYVFPVYGPAAYGDTFGAARGDVSGGWHHGDDIFAPLGAPVVAVASGTVFSIGWNDVGGWRLWLRDQAGNEFYYAHLAAYTTIAANGRHVRAGQVLGFVGNTGDAQGTPFHLHFEVHPVSMLFLGYDGAVDPTRYLDAWERLQDVRILPAVPFYTLQASSGSAPTPGAILLQSSDISTASGLDPGSLSRAMRASPTVDLGAGTPLGQLPTPLPVLDRA